MNINDDMIRLMDFRRGNLDKKLIFPGKYSTRPGIDFCRLRDVVDEFICPVNSVNCIGLYGSCARPTSITRSYKENYGFLWMKTRIKEYQVISYNPHPNDIDIFVVADHRSNIIRTASQIRVDSKYIERWDDAYGVYESWRTLLGNMDILCFTEDEFRENRNRFSVCQGIANDGILLVGYFSPVDLKPIPPGFKWGR